MPTNTSSSKSRIYRAYVICFILIAVSRNHPCHSYGDRVVRERTILDNDGVDIPLGHDIVKRLPNVTSIAKPTIVSNVKPTSTTKKPPVHPTTVTPKPHVLPVQKPNVTTAISPPKQPSGTGKTTKPHVPITAAPTVSTTIGPTHRIVTHNTTTKPHPNASIFAKQTTERPIPSTTTELPLGSYWDGWNDLLTARFWQKRYEDHAYLLQLFLPIAIGVGTTSVLAFLVFIFRCMCALKKSRRLRGNKKMYFDKEGSDKWMLLERASSSDEDAV